MRSSTSSSERLTAADRPGVAQPVPQRPVPMRPWPRMFIVAVIVATLLVGAWEWYWRDYGVTPGYQNSDGLWARERRRIDHGEGGRTVLLGASRMLFDIDLNTWERLSGERPIQLALEGTTPLIELEDLAEDPHFTGRLLVGVAPDVFFSGFEYRGGALKYAHDESPSKRVGQWLSMRVEPLLAFYSPDFALSTVVNRQDWPSRAGVYRYTEVRQLTVSESDRNTYLWSKVERDAQYRDMVRRIWAQSFGPLAAADKAKLDKGIQREIDRTAAVLRKLRAHGIEVLFVRMPSAGEYLKYENRDFPRSGTWDVLLARTGAPGIHFEDYPELQGYILPEWSHLAAGERPRFTEALYRIIERDFWKRDTTESRP